MSIAGPAAKDADASSYSAFRDHLPSGEMVRLFDYWLELVRVNGFGIKGRIDPIELADLLPFLYLEEWDHASEQSKIRLAGESLREMWGGKSFLGAIVDEQMQGAVNDLWKRCDKANFLDQAPTLSRYNLRHRDRDYRWIWDLSLPISDADGDRFVLGIVGLCAIDGLDV